MKKVLIVDDHKAIRFLVTEVLKSHGYNTEEAADGEEALHSLRSKSFDLVITDNHMPGMSGETLIRKAKKLLPDMPFMIMTGSVFPDLMEKWKPLKPRAIFPKPFKIEQMLSKVDEILT